MPGEGGERTGAKTSLSSPLEKTKKKFKTLKVKQKLPG